MRKLTTISLFSGAGGLDYGFEEAGFRTTVAVELDGDACCTLRRNRKRLSVIEGDIHKTSSDAILDAAKLVRGDVDVLIGGPPCQPFSKAGYWAKGDAKRLSDPRSSTLGAFMRVVEDVLPRAFLLENVGAMSFSGKSEAVDLLDALIKGINRRQKVRYTPSIRVLRAADYGVPQIRDRFFLIAARDGTEFRFPTPTHAAAEEQLLVGSQPYRTAWDALHDVEPDDDESLALTGKWADLLPSIPEGENYLWHTERGGGEPLFGWRRRYWSFLLKLSKRLPSWTIQAQPGPATGPFHWSNRQLSRRELCRLQTFPDTVHVEGDHRSVQRQVGNAVPSLLGEVLARAIATQFLGRTRYLKPLQLLRPATPLENAERRRPVPKKYLKLKGRHTPHPGTGRGRRAMREWADAAE